MSWISRALIRAAGSGPALRLASRLPLDERLAVLTGGWRTLNRGLAPRDKLELLIAALRDRRIDKFPLDRPEVYRRAHGSFEIVRRIAGVPGEIVEAGVGRGRSLACFAAAAARYAPDKRIYGFDSFSGFPEATDGDLGSRVPEPGAIEGWSDAPEDAVRAALSYTLDGDDGRITLVPGFFEATMPAQLPDRIALLHVDCDLYEGYLHVLTHALPRLAPGAIAVFDEYGDDRWPGARKAVDEVCGPLGLAVEPFPELERHGIVV